MKRAHGSLKTWVLENRKRIPQMTLTQMVRETGFNRGSLQSTINSHEIKYKKADEAMILNLTLKKQWFDLIASGEKLEEYREIKAYWAVRLIGGFPSGATDENMAQHFANNQGRQPEFIPFTHVRFQHGYAKNAPFVTFEIREICIAEGVPEWGAEPDKRYFVIRLGERLL